MITGIAMAEETLLGTVCVSRDRVFWSAGSLLVPAPLAITLRCRIPLLPVVSADDSASAFVSVGLRGV